MRQALRGGAIWMLVVLSGCVVASSPSVGTPTLRPTAGPLELEDLGFFRIVGAGDHNDLEVGRLDGTIAERVPLLDQMAQPGDGGQWATGPRGGLVLFGDGRDLYVIDVNGRGIRRIFSAPSVIHHGALTPDGRTAYFAMREAGPASWSLWRIAVDGGDPQLVRGRLADSVARHGIVLAAQLLPRAQVAVSPDGGTVAMNECVTRCRVYFFDVATATGQQLSAAESAGDMAYVVGHRILSGVDDMAALGADGKVVVVRGSVLIDPVSGDQRQIPVQEDRTILPGWVSTPWLGAEMPPGWALAVEQGDAARQDCNPWYVAMNLDSGAIVKLETLGSPMCG